MEPDRKIGVLRKKAWTYIETQKPDEAIQCFDEAIGLLPTSAPLIVEKGTALVRLGRHDAALAAFDQALEVDGSYIEAYIERGKCLEAMLRRRDAIACYEKALKVDPQASRALGGLGNALAELREFDDALACFEKLTAMKPREADAWMCKGLLLWKTGKLEAGLDAFDRSIGLNPKLVEAYIHKAKLLRAMDRGAEARRTCAEGIQKGPQFVEGYLLAAELVLEAGRPDDALGYADKALAIDPVDPEAWRIKSAAHEKAGRDAAAKVCRGLHHLHRGALDEALATMDAVLRADEKFIHAWTHKGAVLERMDRLEEALACYDRALALDDAEAKVTFARGMLLYGRLGRKDDGTSALRRAIGLDAKRWAELPPELKKRIDKPRYW